MALYNITNSSLRKNTHCNSRADEAHPEPGIARNELPIGVPFPEDGKEEGKRVCDWDREREF
jgi:hypothetical protein